MKGIKIADDIQKYLSDLSHQVSSDKFREIFNCVVLGKPIRFEIPAKSISRIARLANKLHLQFATSNMSFRLLNDNGMDNWQNTFEYCDENLSNAMKFVYLHSDSEVCERAKQYEETENDFELGLLLSYPKCCVEGYLKWQHEKKDIDPITTIVDSFQFTGKLNNYNFPNPFSRYFGSGLFSHFPCSLNCTATKIIANESFKMLQLNFPTVAEKILQLENSLIIFHKEMGVGLWNKFESSKHCIYVDKSSFYGQGEFKSIFTTIDEINLTKSELTLFSAKKQTSRIPTNRLLFATFLRPN